MTLAKQCAKLLWIQIKMKLGLSAIKYYRTHDKKKFRMNILIIFSLVYLVGMTLFMYGMLYRAVVQSALALGLGSLILSSTVLLAMIMVLIFGAFQINAVVFNSSDIEWYACLPLKPAAVFASKLGMVYLFELLVTMLLLIPAYLLYAIETGAGAVFWIIAIVTLPLVPVIPLALSSIAALPLAKLSSKFRRRELMTVIFTVIVTVLFSAAYIGMSSFSGGIFTGDSSVMSGFLDNAEPVLRLATSVFPPATWLSLALTMSGNMFLSLLLFLVTCVLSGAITLYLANKLYYAGALSALETPAPAAKKSKFRSSSVKTSGAVTAIAVTDFKLVIRSPIYLFNSLSSLYFAIMILIIPLMMRSQWDELRALLVETIEGVSPSLALVITVLILVVSGLINPVASTTLSRAGRSFWVYKTIPVPPRTQITAKLLSSTMFSLLSAVLVAASLCYLLPEFIPLAVASIVPAAFAAISTSAFAMIPDIISPKLKWDSEAEAMKQNMSTLWGMLLAMCPALIVLAALPLGVFMPGLNAAVMMAVLLVITAGTAFGSVALVRWMADSRYNTLAEKL